MIGTIEKQLSAIIREVFMCDDLAIERHTTTLDVPGWDSFKTVEIVLLAEERFGVVIDAPDVDRFHCVGDMVDAIADKLGAVSRVG